MYKPYAIRTPKFDVTSGGIRVMYGLYGALLAKGQVAFLNAVFDDPFIGVYPEIYDGNDMAAPKVVRYILAPPGEMTLNGYPGPKQFGPNDTLFYFSRMFGGNEHNTLFLPILNTYQFRDYGKKRTKKAFFVGKQVNIGLHPKGCVEITRQFATDQQKLADLLNECQVMYCYDHRTAMTEIARLCGCRVVVFPSIVDLETFKLYEPGMNGLGWGKDAKLDSKEFRKHYLNLKQIFWDKLDDFIEETQNA